MNKFSRKILSAAHSWLEKILNHVEPVVGKEEGGEPFHSLSPIKNADVDHYLSALTWALDNRRKESIHNIAITGQYGSGKSSILRTFQAKNTNPEYVFLEISLATFKEEPENGELNEGSKEHTPVPRRTASRAKKSEELLRLIEFSILQQLFYREEDSKIPDSRFKKIRSFSRRGRLQLTAGVLISLVFGMNLFWPEIVESTLKVHFYHWLSLALYWISLLIFIAAVSLVIFRSIRLFYAIRISKFKIKEAEIEIDKGISKSILNNHLDEILYFFEVTGYSVVLIEDLDRFRQAEIFTKLRELNLLINNSQKVEQHVVFIYAVRDEMFTDKDRTKFFDFIIPVIPVINSSNSNDKLSKIIEENDYPISPQLIDDIALFVDDMRLLYNITNEYYIYRQLLDKGLIQDKLLTMIVYKNIYPDDFVLLNDGKGKLFKLLNSRGQFIQDAIMEINDKIKDIKAEIKQMEAAKLRNGVELRMLYLSYYIGNLPNFLNFIVNGANRTLKEIAEDEELFDFIVSDEVSYQYNLTQYSTISIRQKESDITFSILEDEVDSEFSYEERLESINGFWDGQPEVLKEEIQELEKQKAITRHMKLQEILSGSAGKNAVDTSTRQGLLLKLLLREGYIDEDYLDYISLFYVGSLTKEDREFLLHVKSESAMEYDFALQKIENLISKIRAVDFQQPYLLNYNLLDFLLANPKYQEQMNYLIGQLNDQHADAPGFIDGFIECGTNIGVFVKQLAARWFGLWKYISEQSALTLERKEVYFRLILENCEIPDLKVMITQSGLKATIEQREDFLTVLTSESRLKQLIKDLDLKFEKLDFKASPKGLVEFVYKGDYYRLSAQMIIAMIQRFGKLDQNDFDTGNYSAILNSGCIELNRYIEKRINNYITEVYLALPLNIKEPAKAFLQLLNNKELKLDLRLKLIEKVETRISRFREVTGGGMDDELIKYSRVTANWENLIDYFIKVNKVMTPAINDFLNDSINAEELAKVPINTELPYPDAAITEAFSITLINNTEISDESYQILLSTFPYDYEMDEVAQVGVPKMKMLIENSIIHPGEDNFVKIKERYPSLRIRFLEHTKETFMKTISNYELDIADLQALLKSPIFAPLDKVNFINNFNTDNIIASEPALKTIVQLIFAHHPFAVAKSILIAALQQNFPVEDRVKLFNMHYKPFSKAEVSAIFQTFPHPFDDIGALYKSPVIPENQENQFLANNLYERGFISNVKGDRKGIKLVNFKKEK